MPAHFSHNYPTCSSINWPIGSSSLFPFPRTEQDPSFIVSRSFNECLFRPLSWVTVILAIVWSSGKEAISEDSNCARSDLVKARSGFRGCERSFGVRRAWHAPFHGRFIFHQAKAGATRMSIGTPNGKISSRTFIYRTRVAHKWELLPWSLVHRR